MQRYFSIDKNLTLTNKDIHHIINVMRMKKNDKIEIVYDEKVYLCLITDISKNDVKYKIEKEITSSSELTKKVTIVIPLVSENKIDLILQKCTELGAYEFIIYDSQRSKVKVNDKIDKKISRWNLIVKEACEQSFRNYLPKVYKIKDLTEITKNNSELKLVASTKKCEKNLKNILQNSTNCDSIVIVVGPEGGLTDYEEDYLVNIGYNRVTFGDAILRLETAPIFALSAIKYELMR